MAYSGQCANFFSFDSTLRNRTKIDELNFSDYVKCTCSKVLLVFGTKKDIFVSTIFVMCTINDVMVVVSLCHYS